MNNQFHRLQGLEKKPAEVVLSQLKSESAELSMSAGEAILQQVSQYGVTLRDYLDATIQPTDAEIKAGVETGYQAALAFLNLPVKDDFQNNLSLQLAADGFATQPGSRILFPEVVTDMMTWKQGELDPFISTAPLISQVRTVQGNTLIMMELDENGEDLSMNTIAEGAAIPLISIVSSQREVKFFKIGKGYKFTYEFSRRVAIDILTPFVNRMNRQMEIDKVNHAVSILVNGDGVAGATTVDAETSYGGTNGTLDYKSFFKWLVARMAANYPVDTLIMNYATYAEFLSIMLPVAGNTTNFEALASRAGISLGGTGLLGPLSLNIAIGPNVAASTILGINKGETLEELQEAGSDIVENERLIRTQHVQFVRSKNLGYNLVTPSARRGFSFAS